MIWQLRVFTRLTNIFRTQAQKTFSFVAISLAPAKSAGGSAGFSAEYPNWKSARPSGEFFVAPEGNFCCFYSTASAHSSLSFGGSSIYPFSIALYFTAPADCSSSKAFSYINTETTIQITSSMGTPTADGDSVTANFMKSRTSEIKSSFTQFALSGASEEKLGTFPETKNCKPDDHFVKSSQFWRDIETSGDSRLFDKDHYSGVQEEPRNLFANNPYFFLVGETPSPGILDSAGSLGDIDSDGGSPCELSDYEPEVSYSSRLDTTYQERLGLYRAIVTDSSVRSPRCAANPRPTNIPRSPSLFLPKDLSDAEIPLNLPLSVLMSPTRDPFNPFNPSVPESNRLACAKKSVPSMYGLPDDEDIDEDDRELMWRMTYFYVLNGGSIIFS